MPAKHNATRSTRKTTRSIVFVSKATPEDDDFVLWLAPRLEAAGYIVFADILSIDPGDRWRKEITDTLQNKAVKMLLCCRDATLNKPGVQEEIGIASDLVKELKDRRFIIPLRLAPFKKVRFTSPVTTALPDTMDADAEETDDSTLGLFNAEDEETDGTA
jgi:hypothetical protein